MYQVPLTTRISLCLWSVFITDVGNAINDDAAAKLMVILVYLFMAAPGLRGFVPAFSRVDSRGCSRVGANELLVVASLVAGLGLWALWTWVVAVHGLSCPVACGSRDRTCVPYIDRWVLNH